MRAALYAYRGKKKNMPFPVRTIGISYSGSLRAAIPSTKSGRVIKTESALERSLCLLLEFDPLVRTYCEQPVAIPYTVPGSARSRHYTPDFLIEYHQGSPVLAEVKYQAELDAKAAELTPKFSAARQYAATQGWTFQLFTEQDILIPPLLGNARLLLRFRTLAPWPIAPGNTPVADFLLALLAEWGEATPASLTEAAAIQLHQPAAALLPHCWHLLSCGRIGGEVTTAPLTMTSRLWAI
jgi:hypothetical protein